MMSPSRYKKIAVASTFSPRFKQVLAEAKRIRDRFGAELSLIYVGERTEETTRTFKEAFAELGLPAAESCERLYVVRVYTAFDEARAGLRSGSENGEPSTRTFEEEETKLEEFILAAGDTEVPIEAHCLRGNTGFAASDFVQSVEADLLVVPVQTSGPTGERLPNHIAWITDVIPCNLWVIR